jgi:hypothetical protein
MPGKSITCHDKHVEERQDVKIAILGWCKSRFTRLVGATLLDGVRTKIAPWSSGTKHVLAREAGLEIASTDHVPQKRHWIRTRQITEEVGNVILQLGFFSFREDPAMLSHTGHLG